MGTSHPTAPRSTRAVTVGCGGYGSGFGAPRAAGARALFWAWPKSARHRVWPRPGGSCRCTKVGVPQYPNLCTGSCSFPRQGLLRARRRPSCLLLNHSKTKYTRQKIETPARGACREGRTRLKTVSPTRDPGKRSLPGRTEHGISEDSPWRIARPGKARRATSFQARQGSNRDKALAAASFHCVPALQLIWPDVALGPF